MTGVTVTGYPASQTIETAIIIYLTVQSPSGLEENITLKLRVPCSLMQSQIYFSEIKSNQSRILKTSTPRNVPLDIHQSNQLTKSNKPEENIRTAQEKICTFFLDLVKSASPELVLTEFEHLFINPAPTFNTEPQKALLVIIVSKNELEFKNILKRCIYLLLNNWIYGRKYSYAQNLVEMISHAVNSYNISSQCLKTLRTWLVNFINSADYQEVKLFASKYENREQDNWKSRYTSYLLAPQYLNSKNPTEQRQAAKRLSKQLQDQFKFDLAMYTAHSSSAAFNDKKTKNPTALGDEALRLIKTVLVKRGPFSYANLANIFLNQTQELDYKCFKQSLLKYLVFSLEQSGLVESIKIQLGKKLEVLYEEFNDEKLRNGLLLRTCNRAIEHLTTEKSGEPSGLFILIASQGNPLTLAILILKILLICPPARTYLEVCIARLIQYYEGYPQQECEWVINFLEICKIILAIYTENIQYNLVNMEKVNLPNKSLAQGDAFRVFSQSKHEA